MARKPITRSRRAAPQTGGSTPADFDFGADTVPVLVDADTSHDVEVLGARSIPYKSGSIGIELTLKGIETGDIVDLDTLLVSSPGGVSRFVARNRGLLRDLADLEEGESVSFKELLAKLNSGGIRAEVTFYLGKAMDGRVVNKLGSVDALLTDDEED